MPFTKKKVPVRKAPGGVQEAPGAVSGAQAPLPDPSRPRLRQMVVVRLPLHVCRSPLDAVGMITHVFQGTRCRVFLFPDGVVQAMHVEVPHRVDGGRESGWWSPIPSDWPQV